MHATDSLVEANRLMTVCNSCRYCEGLCAVFPAMELRRTFTNGDLNYLANLCHNCGACYADCQFVPPHEFAVHVPKTMTEVRNHSYASYAWPKALAGLYAENAMKISLITAACVAGFILAFVAIEDPGALSSTEVSFYALMPHGAMAVLFGVSLLYAVLALIMGARNFWRDMGEPIATLSNPRSLWQAIQDALSLRYLDGGGDGCYATELKPDDRRRLFHHFTFGGFGLCFAATTVATLYHYVCGREAPYPWWDLPVLLGAVELSYLIAQHLPPV